VSLRLRLFLSVVVLVLVGLLVAGAVTYVSLHSFLLDRVDQQLVAARNPVVHRMSQANDAVPPVSQSGSPPVGMPDFPSGTWGALLDSSGKTLVAAPFTFGGATPPRPKLGSSLVHAASAAERDAFVTVGSVSGGTNYRVLAWQPGVVAAAGGEVSAGPYTFVVAIPLTEVDGTISQLLLVEVLVTVGVLLGLAGLAWWLVRREMRPLEDMAATAGAIAAGDLSQRIERAESVTEVGRLGLALNAMLAQIEQAFARRQASENALRRFLAQASHELRTPLASIRGYSELFRRGAKDRPEDLELAMRRIEQEAARMGVLVEELLLLARLDEGRPMERAPVDLARVAADAVADARITDPGRSISCEAPEPVVVTGDDARLRQVATNLVTNAVRHAGPDARVWVSARVEGTWAELAVRDDGVGIPTEVAERVFEPFYTSAETGGEAAGGGAETGGVREADGSEGAAESTAGDATAGGAVASAGVDAVAGDDLAQDRAAGPGLEKSATGLGLAIALSIARAHGGRIELETSPGQGARFVVRLPLNADEGAAAAEEEEV
jgi:two-component system OmpR family sensor kinase